MLTHEFGHFHGGDTKLGPWVYKTRAAVARTIHALGSSEFLAADEVQDTLLKALAASLEEREVPWAHTLGSGSA